MSEKTPSQPSPEEMAKLKADLESANKKAAEAVKALEALRRKRELKKQDPSPSTPPQVTMADARSEETHNDHGHAEGQPHYIGSWQRYCPTCGDQNPDFKDETTCDGCGVHLGAKEVATKLKACPNCGGHSASMIKK
jgi:hypothetical protein